MISGSTMSKNNKIFVNIILPIPLMGTFTYEIPTRLISSVTQGSMVKCSFGAKTYWAVVQDFTETAPTHFTIKPILDVIYPHHFIPENVLKYWKWISEYYLCPVGEVMQAALPNKIIPTLSFKYTALYTKNELHLTNSEQVIYNALLGKEWGVKTIQNTTGVKSASSIIKRLEQKGLVKKTDPLREIRVPSTETRVEIHKDYSSEKAFEELLQTFKRSTAKKRALLAVKENSKESVISKKDLTELFQVSQLVYGFLKDHNCIVEKKVSKDFSIETNKSKLAFLSQKQEDCFFAIKKFFNQKQVVLLHGVTSSGKTEIYFHLIAEHLKKGDQILFLLPEITLTQQIISRFHSVFGHQLKVYHSKISDTERARIWHGVKDKSVQLVVGVRSAALLPFQNLGLVIVDEEHENTYKQTDPAPRYNGRDAALMLGTMQNAKVLLGSATPSIQSYNNAKTGKYGLVELYDRHKTFPMPTVILVDLLDCYKKNKLVKHFSYELLEGIKNALENGEGVLLFQNRRGYAPTIECKDCGYVHLCPNCNVTLTLHKSSKSLVCHYCAFQEPVFYRCPECESPKIMDKGMGTEKIEDEIKHLLPNAKVARLDTDSAGSMKNVDNTFRKFESGHFNVLVGTQMISKGIDFGKVGLVGVLNADNLLNFPNYLAGERSFQLLTQVAGRAGRATKGAKVIIQTHHFDHPILKAVQEHDYNLFLTNELEERKAFHYPPYVKIIHINVRHRDERVSEQFSQLLAEKMLVLRGADILGPERPGVDKIKNFYYRKITLKCSPSTDRKKLGGWLYQVIEVLKSHESFRYVTVSFDADPTG